MDERKRRVTFHRNRKFWIILVIALVVLYVLSTIISGRRANHNDNTSMPKIEQFSTQTPWHHTDLLNKYSS